jgi:hypothetical protein
MNKASKFVGEGKYFEAETAYRAIYKWLYRNNDLVTNYDEVMKELNYSLTLVLAINGDK